MKVESGSWFAIAVQKVYVHGRKFHHRMIHNIEACGMSLCTLPVTSGGGALIVGALAAECADVGTSDTSGTASVAQGVFC